ncbi:MAG: hypothetical protein J2P49_07050 [Methylocapsa sp.]|nr:hypothetical protein [Methylocapsa sp.]
MSSETPLPSVPNYPGRMPHFPAAPFARNRFGARACAMSEVLKYYELQYSVHACYVLLSDMVGLPSVSYQRILSFDALSRPNREPAGEYASFQAIGEFENELS